MTRREFLEDVNDFYELVNFCNENGCDVCEDIFDDDMLDEYVEDDLREATGDDSWRNIREWLDDIPTGYDWYRRDGYFDYHGVDGDFDDYKDSVLTWMDDYGTWDEEDEDEEDLEEEEDDEEDDDVFEVEEGISMKDMIKACFNQADEQQAEVEAMKRQQDAELEEFLKHEAEWQEMYVS